VGSFTVDAPVLSANRLRVGEPVKLSVKVHGEGNLARLVAPAPPKVRDWQVFAADTEGAPLQGFPGLVIFGGNAAQAPGTLTFNYTLIPLTEETRATPAIPFSCFEPKRGAYTDLTIPPVTVTVAPGSAPTQLSALDQAGAVDAPAEKEPVLSGLASAPGPAMHSLEPMQQHAWFPLVQLAPGLVFLGLWGWDRRRRFLQAHPDIVLRRRARRALRRERRALLRAARAGDSPRFAALGVGAIRIACAPHYPAEPRALVASDVLPLLPEADRCGRAGEVIRQLFSSADAARFSDAPRMTDGLLTLHPDLDRVLEQLEARL
jgi:hypothetical protein